MNMSFIPPAADFAPTSALLAVIADPEAAKQRLEQLKVAAAEARGTLESIRAEQRALDQAKSEASTIAADLKAKRDRHQAELTAATERHQADCERRDGKLAERERGLIARDRQLAADREALDALRADLERRLAAIKAAAA